MSKTLDQLKEAYTSASNTVATLRKLISQETDKSQLLTFRWYVADISLFNGNPVSRYMVIALGNDRVEILNTGHHNVKKLAELNYFKIVSEIHEMRERPTK